MNLLQFLRQVRKDGGDISRFRVSILDSDSGVWRKGLKVNDLRGNRLSVEHGGNYELMAGHSCLHSLVQAISHITPSKKNLRDSGRDEGSILVEVKRP